MSSNRRPWFPWYPKDFVVDEKVQALSDDAELLYRRALDVLWQANDLHLPNNCQKLANILARNWSKERFDSAWSEIQFEGFELFRTTQDGLWIYSSRLQAEAQKIESINKKRQDSGKKGGLARAKQPPSKSQPKAKQTPSHTDTDSNTYSQAKTILTYLNELSSRGFKNSDSSLKPISARLSDGYTVEDCKLVCEFKWNDQKFDKQYYRPQTLFSPGKFEGYLYAAKETAPKKYVKEQVAF